ncbi:MAG TPA: murein biosynthesis integral membrane protein MurJ [Gammaproteobacteria bacterium]|nr:murein biosynthesis integral membrane protein MurJ [Gammaproteobacteria bacterium]
MSTVGVFTLGSRILGFVRDLVLAHLFGANAMTDAFFVAFKIPNFLRRLFAEGAFATAFVPVLTEYRTTRSPQALRQFIDHVAGTLGLALLVVSTIGVLAAPLVVGLFAFGWVLEEEHARLALAADMLRLTFPYLFFISLTAFAGGIMNAWNRFAVPAFTPVLLNLSLIGCALWLSPHLEQPVVALAWGVLIAGITQFVFQLPFLARLELLPRPRPSLRDPGVRQVLRLMVPALFAVSVTQINLLLDTVLASTLIAGSISWLYYSDRLMEFPLGVLGVALGTVLLPRLSREQAEQDPANYNRTLDWGLRMGLLFGLPAAVGLAALAGPMISTLFQSEVFTAQDVAMARLSLMAYAAGLPAFILVKVLAPAYYARQDTRTPVRIAVIAMSANMAFNLLLIFPLKHAGLALATSLGAGVNAWLLLRGLRRRDLFRPAPGWGRLALQVGLACGAMLAVLVWGAGALEDWFLAGRWERAARLALWILGGAAAYFLTLFLLGVRPAQLRRSEAG